MTEARKLRLFIHVEEPSMKEALNNLVPKLCSNQDLEWRIIDHGSKHALVRDLPARMRGYGQRSQSELRILVLVDQGKDDCKILKKNLEATAASGGLSTKTAPDAAGKFQVVNRDVIEELEAWFIGDVEALVKAYPRIPGSLAQQTRYRDPDAVVGGTWEALLHALNKAGYYVGVRSLPKIEVARRVAPMMMASRNRSRSFQAFVFGLESLLAT